MNEERLRNQGYLAQLSQDEKRLVLRLNGMRESMRRILDPMAEIARIDGEALSDGALQFASLQGELKAVRAKIARVEDLLGIG